MKYSTMTMAAGSNVNWKVKSQIEEHIALIAVISISVASIKPPTAA